MTDEMMAKLNQRLHWDERAADADAFVREATREMMARLDQRLHLLGAEDERDSPDFAPPASSKSVELAPNRAAFASTD